MLKLISAPLDNDRSPRYMERALASIHHALRPGQTVKLICAGIEGRVGLFVECENRLERIVCDPIAAAYPNCSLKSVETAIGEPVDWQSWHLELKLTPEIYPILRHAQFEDMLNRNFADPMSGILRAIIPSNEICSRVEISISRISHHRHRAAKTAIYLLDRQFFKVHHRLAEYFAERITRRRKWFLVWILGVLARMTAHTTHTNIDTTTSRLHEREDIVQAASDKVGGHLFETYIRLTVSIVDQAPIDAHDRLRQIAGAFGAFTQSRLARFDAGPIRKVAGREFRGQGSLLSHEELATLFHPPTFTAAAERLQTKEFSELEPPPKFYSGQESGAVTIGRVLFRDDDRVVGIDQDARRRHMYIVGSTGAGKSTLLLNMIHQDMHAGRGLTIFDVHGDLADSVVRLLPRNRKNDTTVFDAASSRVISFNPLECNDPRRIDQVTSGVVSAFKKIYESWGPRLENLLRYAVFTTIEQNGTLLELLMLLTEKAYRNSAILRIKDHVVRSFWINEFSTWNSQYRTEAVSSVTNKLLPFLTSPRLREITTAKSSFDLREVMDRERILVINLSRGRLGQDNSTLLGSLFLTSIEQAALSRAEIPEPSRRNHFLYLDEFQSLVTPSTAIMLSEARKYRLALILSHQFTRQLDPATYHAIIGNCGTLLSFRVGVEDAELLGPAMSKHPGQLQAADICNLPNYTAYCRLLVDGHPSKPFSIRTLPPVISKDRERGDIVLQTSENRNNVN